MYITAQGERLDGGAAIDASRREQQIPYSQIMQEIQELGLKSKDKQSLEYWGLPDGLIKMLKDQAGISKLFKWQA